MKKVFAFVLMFLMIPALTFAGVGGGDVPTATSPVTVGQTGLGWSFTITNTSTTPNDVNNVQVLSANNIFFTTACGKPDADGICDLVDQEAAGTISISPLTAIGQAGTACAGVSFTVAASGSPNEYIFTPASNIILGPSNVGGPGARCQVNFSVNINAGVIHDSSVSAGLQTSQLARVEVMRDTITLEPGSATGTSTVTINRVLPAIVTAPNPTTGLVGTVLHDAATLSNGIGPTGTITFKLFSPTDPACAGVPIFTNTVPVAGNGVYNTSVGFPTVAAGTYHWVATYSGDISNEAVSSICNNEAVLIELPPPPPPSGGECPYIGVVGNDADANAFYFSQKYQQFMYDNTGICVGTFPPLHPQTRVGGEGCEQFRANSALNQPEICDTEGVVLSIGHYVYFGETNARITKQNAGYFAWWIRLPRKPDGEINIVIQCGVLKPNTFAFEGFDAVMLCAAETGERIGTGQCARVHTAPGVNPIVNTSLPKLTAIAYPGPYSLGFTPFNLTAYKNPGTYAFPVSGQPFSNNASLQVLDGTAATRILLKACMDKTVVAKIPVTGQINVLGQTEADLEAGDLIQVRLDIPINNTVDIYCHSQSARLQGIGLCSP